MTSGLRYDTPRDELIGFVPATAQRVLDIGCGTGRYTQHLTLARPDIETWGVEPDTEAAAAARENVGRLIELPFLEAVASLPTGAFDVVAFNDVLEHLVDPAIALDEVPPLLTANGVVIASIPNIRHRSVVWPLLRRGRWDYADTGPLDRTHLRFFTRSTAATLFTQLGWRVESVTGINRRWDWWDEIEGHKAKLARRATFGWLDEFLCMQYVVVARAPES